MIGHCSTEQRSRRPGHHCLNELSSLALLLDAAHLLGCVPLRVELLLVAAAAVLCYVVRMHDALVSTVRHLCPSLRDPVSWSKECVLFYGSEGAGSPRWLLFVSATAVVAQVECG